MSNAKSVNSDPVIKVRVAGVKFYPGKSSLPFLKFDVEIYDYAGEWIFTLIGMRFVGSKIMPAQRTSMVNGYRRYFDHWRIATDLGKAISDQLRETPEWAQQQASLSTCSTSEGVPFIRKPPKTTS